MKRIVFVICGIAGLASIIAIIFFVSKFGLGPASTIGNWGAVGDFFGGVLNPTFALLSLILIAYTLMQNKKALEQSEKAIEQGTKAIEQNEKALQVSNKELELTRNELANSSKALEEQASLLAVQSFETTFFNMLDLHNKLLDNTFYGDGIHYDVIKSELDIGYFNDGSFHKNKQNGLDSFSRLLIAVNSAFDYGEKRIAVLSIFNIIYKYENQAFGSYFRNVYQILKLLQSSLDEYGLQKKYSNILRAQLSNQELTILVLNCLCPLSDNGQFRKLAIHFELLEHLDITYKIGVGKIITFTIHNPILDLTSNEIDQYLFRDTKGKLIQSAFGQNSQILKYCKFRNMTD